MPNIYQDIPKDTQEELFEEILKSENVKIERIISDGHTSPKEGWYESEQSEWVIVLQGEARLLYEDKKEIELKCGEYQNIPAFTKHKVSYTSFNERTIWLAIYY